MIALLIKIGSIVLGLFIGYKFIKLIKSTPKEVVDEEPEEEPEDKTPKIKSWFENKGDKYRYKK